MISINYRDSRPIYEQIEENLCRLMATGVIAAGEKLPSVRELASELTINPNTIQRAYRELEAQGYIYSVPGKGSFASDTASVREAKLSGLLEEFDKLTREITSLGTDPETLKERLDKFRNSPGGDEK